jgi:hypothetical protein
LLLLLLLLLQVNSVFFNYYNTYVSQGLLNDISALAGANRRVYFGGFSGGSMVAVFGALALGTKRVGNVYLYGHEKVSGTAASVQCTRNNEKEGGV